MEGRRARHGAVLRGGMQSGKTSVMIRLDTPLGSFVVENSGANFRALAHVIGDDAPPPGPVDPPTPPNRRVA